MRLQSRRKLSNTRLSATLSRDPCRQGWDSWTDEQRAWLRKHTGKKIKGTVTYKPLVSFRTDGVKNIVLIDDEIKIHRRLPKK